MKVVVWGSGIRGQRLHNSLLENTIVAYIDSNIEKIGSDVLGVPIISFEEYLKNYSDYIILISPYVSDEIVSILEINNIKHYFVLFDEILVFKKIDTKMYDNFKNVFDVNDGLPKSYLLYGVTFYNLILAEFLQKHGHNCKVVYEVLNEKIKAIVNRVDISISSLAEIDIDKFDEMLVDFADYDTMKNRFSNQVIIRDNETLYLHAENILYPEMIQFKDIHKGERAFIVCTGPSLKMEDLDCLHDNNEYSISMNKVFLSKELTQWRPDYYVVLDDGMIDVIKDDIVSYDVKHKFINKLDKWSGVFTESNIYECYSTFWLQFCQDLRFGLYHFGTTAHSCIQLAVYMGFSEIYLIGVDFNYSYDWTDDRNHFIKGYSTNYKNEVPPAVTFAKNESLAGYEYLKEYASMHDIKIYNATRGGKLEVFDRVDFDSIFEK